jgi:hypothetical protein
MNAEDVVITSNEMSFFKKKKFGCLLARGHLSIKFETES